MRKECVGIEEGKREIIKVGNGENEVGRKKERREEVEGGGRKEMEKGEVVIKSEEIVGMELDSDRIMRIKMKKMGMIGKSMMRIGEDKRRIEIEEDEVEEIKGEVMRGERSWREWKEKKIKGIIRKVIIWRKEGKGERNEKRNRDRDKWNRMDKENGKEIIKIWC